MPNLSIKNVPLEVVEKLRQRAALNHRSLQGELMALVCAAIGEENNRSGAPERAEAGWKTADQLLAERKAQGIKVVTRAPRAADIIRKERDAR